MRLLKIQLVLLVRMKQLVTTKIQVHILAIQGQKLYTKIQTKTHQQKQTT